MSGSSTNLIVDTGAGTSKEILEVPAGIEIMTVVKNIVAAIRLSYLKRIRAASLDREASCVHYECSQPNPMPFPFVGAMRRIDCTNAIW